MWVERGDSLQNRGHVKRIIKKDKSIDNIPLKFDRFNIHKNYGYKYHTELGYRETNDYHKNLYKF